jgi:probable HAF family extracellular repeat protein
MPGGTNRRDSGSARPARRRFGLVAAAVVALAIDRGAGGASADFFSVTPLENLGSGSSYAMSGNASGQVAGYSGASGGPLQASLSGAGGTGVTALGTLSGSGVSYARSVNTSGQAAGFSTAAGGFIHAFVSAPNGGALTDLGTLGGTTSFGFAVNDASQVTGYSTLTISGKTQAHAFVTAPGGGAMTDLGTLGSGTSSSGYAINASGQVTGYSYLAGAAGYFHAFLTMNGSMKDLGTLAGGTNSIGQAVNASGQVAGVSYFANGTYRAFLSDASGGTLHDLGTLTPGGSSYAYGANDKGQVVGYATTASGGTDAFLYSNGQMLDLNTLIPSFPGVHLTDAMSITDNGYIVAQGFDASGQPTAFLLQAIPEPASLVLLGAGIAGLGLMAARRRRRRAGAGRRN